MFRKIIKQLYRKCVCYEILLMNKSIKGNELHQNKLNIKNLLHNRLAIEQNFYFHLYFYFIYNTAVEFYNQLFISIDINSSKKLKKFEIHLRF